MAGLDKILEQILKEANDNAGSIKSEAQGKADSIISEAEKKAEEIAARAKESIEREVADCGKRFESSADMQKKQAFLAAKQGMIGECLSKAYDKIMEQDDASYFGMLIKLLKDNLQAREGTLYLSKKDISRLPADFMQKAEALASECGGKLKLSEETRNIDGGFVLAYGGIEENSSIKAMFDERGEELQDAVQKLLFP